eukprot:96673_1
MPMTIGIPVKLLHEGEGHIVSVELISGELFRGQLKNCEDSMNIQIENVTVTARDGRISKLQHVYVRGSQIRFIIFPDMLAKAPMFTRIDPKNKNQQALGIGRGIRLRGGGGSTIRTFGAGRMGGRGRGD